MGNRAVLTFSGMGNAAPALYLHWNGGRASVEGILQACRAARHLDMSTPARVRDVVAIAAAGFIGGSTYVGTMGRMDQDNGDNGVYMVDPVTLTITGRRYAPRAEEVDPVKTAAIAAACADVLSGGNDALCAAGAHVATN